MSHFWPLLKQSSFLRQLRQNQKLALPNHHNQVKRFKINDMHYETAKIEHEMEICIFYSTEYNENKQQAS